MGIRKYKNGTIHLTGNDANEFAKAIFAPIRVKEFNNLYQPGDTVIVIDDEGNEFTDTIKSPASITGNHTIVAWLQGKGLYLADRVKSKVEEQ